MSKDTSSQERLTIELEFRASKFQSDGDLEAADALRRAVIQAGPLSDSRARAASRGLGTNVGWRGYALRGLTGDQVLDALIDAT